MARGERRESSAGTYALVLIALLIVVAMCWLVYYVYQQYEISNAHPVQQAQINDLQSQVNELQAQLTKVQTNQEEFSWWPVLRWVLVIIAIVIIALAFLKYYYAKTDNGHLTIDKGLELGTAELLEKHHFVVLNCYGKSVQRREGSAERVLLLEFSRHQKVPGMAPPPHGQMHYAVLNNDWENRYPSESGWTFMQFMNHLHDMEVIGFSIEKTAELAGLEYLETQGRNSETFKKLAGDLGLSSDRGAQ